MLSSLFFEVSKFWLEIPSICVLHENAEGACLCVKKRGFVGNDVGNLDGGKESDLVEGTIFLFLSEFG